MLSVKNRKAIRKLANRSFQANRGRNIIAAAAIALTTILFSALFTIGFGMVESLQMSTMRQSGSSAHGSFKNVTQEQYDQLARHPLAKEMSRSILCANRVENPEFLKRRVELWYHDKKGLSWGFCEPEAGRAPEAADEIMMDTKSLDLLGLPYEIGQQIRLSLTVRQGDAPVDRIFTLSGYFTSYDVMNVGFGIVSDDYLTAHADELTYTYNRDFDAVGSIRADVKFQNTLNLDGKLDQMVSESGYSTDISSSEYIASNANWAYLSSGMGAEPAMLMAAAGGLALIVLTGYLIIYNIFQISVIRDIRFYGLLKTIGTTGRQLRRIIRRQTLMLSAMGIPVGLAIGFLIGRAIVPWMMEQSSYGASAATVSLNPSIFIGAALFSLITVFLSTRKPAAIAARVSPVEAVRFTDGLISGKNRQKKSTDGGKLFRMALSNLGRNKKRTVLVILSLSLSLVLLNCVFTLSRGFDMDKYLAKNAGTDFLIANANYFNIDHYLGGGDDDTLSESFIQAASAQPGIIAGGKLFGNGRISIKGYEFPPETPRNEAGMPMRQFGAQSFPYNTDEEGNYPAFLYGLEAFPLSLLDIVAGETDMKLLKEKLATGKYVIEGLYENDYGEIRWNLAKHKIGDSIMIANRDGGETEAIVIAQCRSKNSINRRISDDFNYYTSAEGFSKIVPDSSRFIMSYCFNADQEHQKTILDFLEQYTTAAEPTMDFESKFTIQQEFEQTRTLFLTVGGILAFIIGLIGILNFINSMLTSIITRRREFAILQAIGMTGGQLRRLLVLEGLCYALGTILLSLALGVATSLLVIPSLTGSIWFFSYQFIIWPLFVACPVLLIIGAAVPMAAFHFSVGNSIVDRLREDK